MKEISDHLRIVAVLGNAGRAEEFERLEPDMLKQFSRLFDEGICNAIDLPLASRKCACDR